MAITDNEEFQILLHEHAEAHVAFDLLHADPNTQAAENLAATLRAIDKYFAELEAKAKAWDSHHGDCHVCHGVVAAGRCRACTTE